jgi:uncharacterized protein DUF6220
VAREYARVAYVVAAWIFVLCVLVQLFLAGLGVFAGYQNFFTHRDFAYLFGWLPLVMVLVGLVGRLPRRMIVGALVLFGLMALQSVFIAFRTQRPELAALHPVNGGVILLLGVWLAQRARAFVPAPLGTAERTQLADSTR